MLVCVRRTVAVLRPNANRENLLRGWNGPSAEMPTTCTTSTMRVPRTMMTTARLMYPNRVSPEPRCRSSIQRDEQRMCMHVGRGRGPARASQIWVRLVLLLEIRRGGLCFPAVSSKAVAPVGACVCRPKWMVVAERVSQSLGAICTNAAQRPTDVLFRSMKISPSFMRKCVSQCVW